MSENIDEGLYARAKVLELPHYKSLIVCKLCLYDLRVSGDNGAFCNMGTICSHKCSKDDVELYFGLGKATKLSNWLSESVQKITGHK